MSECSGTNQIGKGAEMVEFATVILLAATLLQLGAAYYAYRLMRSSGSFLAWTLITAMFILMVLRRLVVFLAPYTSIEIEGVLIGIVASTITLLISASAFAGMYGLMKIFRK